MLTYHILFCWFLINVNAWSLVKCTHYHFTPAYWYGNLQIEWCNNYIKYLDVLYIVNCKRVKSDIVRDVHSLSVFIVRRARISK